MIARRMLPTLAIAVAIPAASARAQVPGERFGEVVPRDVREMYDRGLQYLAKTQTEQGDWAGGDDQGPGITGMALMVFLASGEDPNFGLYSNNVRKALRSIIDAAGRRTGIIGHSMYHHGFAMLGLAEAYGAVDERNLWPDGKGPRSIGQALELAVRAAITSQKKNPLGAWRYSPDAERRRHVGQRRRPRRPARGPQRRDRGPRRGDRQGDRLLHVDDLDRRPGRLLRRHGRLRRIAGPHLDRDARLRRRPAQGPARSSRRRSTT